MPDRVRALAHGGAVRPVWVNEAGGLTFELGAGARRRFVKWAPSGSGIDLSAESARLSWAGRFARVPALLDEGADDAGSWIVTGALPGQMAVAPRWKADAARAVTVIGAGLRALHDALPVGRCPFSRAVEVRVAEVQRRAGAALLDPASWHSAHSALDIDAALELVADPPPTDLLVVCHGDACAPNTMISDDGRFAGHVDLGSLGKADRWADLAVATWSVGWNYGTRWEQRLLDAYGVEADHDRNRYYRLLYDLCP